ncbi:MAG: hypothetical protein GY757_41145 [bacterium]|nr:hypothetical protein [bacterium]
MKQKNIGLIVSIILILSLLAACGGKSDSIGIELKVTLLPETITDQLYVKMNYDFSFTEKFKGVSDEYQIFVHFWRTKNKEMLLGDDHVPQQKLSHWKQGAKINYSRTIFIPNFLDEFDIDFEGYEKIKLTVGLYIPKKEESKIILFEKKIDIQSASFNAPEIVYDEGWHQSETEQRIKNKDERTWRWTAKKAVCIIENPKKDCLFKVRGGVDKSKFEDQKIILKINETILEEFIPTDGKFAKEYIVTPEMMGNEDEFKLTIETDKSFIPSALNPDVKDDREMGIQIFFLYFREHIK